MDLARAPRRRPLTARKKGSGYENEVEFGIPTQRLGRKAYVLLLKNMATAMNATVRGRQKQYILHLQKQIILKLS